MSTSLVESTMLERAGGERRPDRRRPKGRGTAGILRVALSGARTAAIVAAALCLCVCATTPHQRAATVTPVPKTPAAPPAASQPKATAAAPAQRPSSISANALGVYRTPQQMHAPPSDDELQVVASAKTLIGMPPEATVTVNGRQFTLDCIGTVSAIFYRMHIDVTKDFARYAGNGVTCLYLSLKDRKVLHKDKYPRPGDVVIWDNTWDANDNGNRADDLLTHAGVVLAVDDDGTIHYVHENYRRGIIVEVMNLLKPEVYQDESGRMLNSPMAMSTVPGGPRAEHWVSGDLFDTFGDVLKVKSYYHVADANDPDREESQNALALVEPGRYRGQP